MMKTNKFPALNRTLILRDFQQKNTKNYITHDYSGVACLSFRVGENMRHNECRPPRGVLSNKRQNPNPKIACAIMEWCTLLYEFSA